MHVCLLPRVRSGLEPALSVPHPGRLWYKRAVFDTARRRTFFGYECL